jgi:general nucleoside transport system ATP-binding protein
MLQMRGICKSYGSVRANWDVDFDVPGGRIVGLLGENGSGKTTLMKVLFGIIAPDAGTITINGRRIAPQSPREAIAAGLGMIHQHFTLVDAMSVTENVMLGWDRAGYWLRPREIASLIARASQSYGLKVDPDAIVGDLPHGQRQRVEIIKTILRGAELLILDEPTSNLSPPEVAGLLDVMRRLREQGRGIVFISHKLDEVLEICDEIVVLRDGEVAGRRAASGASKSELARMMICREVATAIEKRQHDAGAMSKEWSVCAIFPSHSTQERSSPSPASTATVNPSSPMCWPACAGRPKGGSNSLARTLRMSRQASGSRPVLHIFQLIGRPHHWFQP